MRRLILLAATALVLTGCGSDGGNRSSEPSADRSPSQATARSLKDSCPLLEKATPPGALPSNERLAKYGEDLDRLSSEGDTETRNAIKFLQDANTASMTASQGSEALDAFDKVTGAFRTVAARCAAVGSSAFQ